MRDAHLAYKRSKFATRLPRDRFFTQGHLWLADLGSGRVRLGFTKFATRMLGEVVEFEFDVTQGQEIAVGQVLGWFEGFKAVSDLYSPIAGVFLGGNPALETQPEAVHKDPYEDGWLFDASGTIPEDALPVEGYAGFLDATIDRMMGSDA